MELWLGAVTQGAAYGLLALAVYLAFRVLKFPDISVDGTFTLGAAVFGVVVGSQSGGQVNPWLGLVLGFAVGLLGGLLTGLLHVGLKVNDLLSGIITMTFLYSVNLRVMGRSNLPVDATLAGAGVPILLAMLGLAMCALIAVWGYLRTDTGLAVRAVGDNPEMAAANGVPVPVYKVFGLAISNGFAGLCGAVIAVYNGFADITMGIGALVTGMAGVMIGERFFPPRKVWMAVMGCLVGSIVFRLLIAGALQAGLNPIDLRGVTAVLVLLALCLRRGT